MKAIKQFVSSLAVLAMWAISSVAGASAVTFSFTSGGLGATAAFDIVGGSLQVTLTNTGTGDVLAPQDVLTAVFFNLTVPGLSLTPFSASLGGGSTVFFGPSGGGNVGGEWAYGSGLAGPGGAAMGLSSSGFGLFGSANFGGANLQGPTAVDGLQYGITSAGDNTATGNAAVTGGNALIKNSVVFVLNGVSLPSSLTSGMFSNVSFQYGTALTEPNFPGDGGGGGSLIPEPQTLALVALGLWAAGLFRRQRRV